MSMAMNREALVVRRVKIPRKCIRVEDNQIGNNDAHDAAKR